MPGLSGNTDIITGQIAFDCVVNVEVIRFSGHVYSIQTEKGWYISNGIITHNCSVFYQVLGGPDFPEQMQADSTPGNRKFVPFQTGEEWFASLSKERQQRQASFKATPAKYKAYLDGHPLSEFVGEHTDPVFGRMTVEESLKGMFGEEKAKTYYVPRTPSRGKEQSEKVKASKPTKESTIKKPKTAKEILYDLQEYQATRETEDMTFARKDYATDGYKLINTRLRNGEKLGEDLGFISKQLDKEFSVVKGIPNEIEVWRGATLDISKLNEGTIFADNGYVSTSLSRDQVFQFARKGVSLERGAEKPVIMQIKLPKGTRVISPSLQGDQFSFEDEILLKRGSNFRVTKIFDTEDIYTRIELEYLP
jgi:hypothetical protein